MRVTTETGINRKNASAQETWPALRIGTMSSEWWGEPHPIRPAQQGRSVDIILDALNTHRPDVLLTAGYSLPDDAALDELKVRLQGINWDGLLFVEVQKHAEDLPGHPLPRQIDNALPSLSAHCLFAYSRRTGWQCMGRQYFITCRQARINAGNRLQSFVGNLENRTIEFKGRRFGALICGEMNVLQGRTVITPWLQDIEDWLRSLDVVVNATHDLMGNAGTLMAKRSWFSQGGRAYLSASNWNTKKVLGGGRKVTQRRTAATLHTFYLDGVKVDQVLPKEPHPDYEYREAFVPAGAARRLDHSDVRSNSIGSTTMTAADADQRTASGATVPVSQASKLVDTPTINVSKTMASDKSTSGGCYSASAKQSPESTTNTKSASTSSRPKGKKSEPLWEMLKAEFPDVQCEAKFDWLTLPRGDEASSIEAAIREALILDCHMRQGQHANAKKNKCTHEQLAHQLKSPPRPQLEFDFYIPSLRLAIEFDERQHFSVERAVSLACYGKKVKTSFSVREWIDRCNKIQAVDADPIWRDWQRAYRDAIRDVRAAEHGVKLIRYRFDAMPTIEEIRQLASLASKVHQSV